MKIHPHDATVFLVHLWPSRELRGRLSRRGAPRRS